MPQTCQWIRCAPVKTFTASPPLAETSRSATQKGLAMLSIIAYVVAVGTVLGFLGLVVSMALGRTPNTTQPSKRWYPAGPDPEPWRVK